MTDTEQRQIFAENLSWRIEKSGKDQKTIALDIDVLPTTFNTWVKGRAIPPVSTIKRLATYLNCSLTDLVDEQNGNEITPRVLLVNYFDAMNTDGQKALLNYARLIFNSGEYITK